jgi:hypothetical protein
VKLPRTASLAAVEATERHRPRGGSKCVSVAVDAGPEIPGSLIAAGLAVVAADGLVDLVAVHGDGLGREHAQSHFVAANVDDRDDDVVADPDAFVPVAAEN